MARGIIIDDSKFMRKLINDVLTRGGHEVLAEADNGNEGITLYNELKPDFITLDVTMAGLDGVRIAQEIKTSSPNAKIIILSAMSEKTLRLNYKSIQADAFILKPFDADELLQTVNQIL